MCERCTFGASETVEETLEVEEDLVQCPNCAEWCDEDDMGEVSFYKYDPTQSLAVEVTEQWCDDCTRTCYSCGTRMRSDDAYYVWDEWYCEEHTRSCARCEETIPTGYTYCSDDCADEGCDCESPAMSFTIRNDGHDPLANDERTTVALPAGIITDEGLEAIQYYLLRYANGLEGDSPQETRVLVANMRNVGYRFRGTLDPRWQTKEGNYTKRLSKYAYQHHGIKLPPEVISQVGCIASDHSSGRDLHVEVTRDLNLSPEEFANEGSCWWQSESQSRCALKSNGGFGLRAFGSSERDGYEEPNGRAWVIPLRNDPDFGLTPTFESLEPDAFVVFNGYGNLGGYAGARVMAHLAGMTYRKVDFSCNGSMYINGGSAYLVAPEDIAAPFTDGSLTIEAPIHAVLFNTEQVTIESKEYEYV
jgi:hypothetical protein